MLLFALVFPLLMARAAAAHAPDFVPDDPPPWGVAMLAKMGRMEDTISSLQTTINAHAKLAGSWHKRHR
eukprot:SAG25_NODE_109_length_15249_cov_11.793201_12_plen_69_part_00